jgi:membrane protease subunit HflK
MRTSGSLATRAARLRALARWGLAPLLVAAFLGSGFYSVQSDESAVAFVLGRAVGRDELPGMHWNPPWPFGRVIVEKTATNFTMPIGYRLLERSGEPPISDQWLTGDTNVITGRLDIQYSIRSLTQFALAHEQPRELLRRAGERALSRFLVSEGVDAAITTKRAALQDFVRRTVQELLDADGVGIQVQAVSVQELAPPLEGQVRAAFQEVQNSSADRERAISEAHAYEAQVLAEAQGEAQRRISEATGARYRRIEVASGEAQRFAALAREHDRAPAVTEQRLYLETLERLLPSIQTYVVEPAKDGKVNLRIVR